MNIRKVLLVTVVVILPWTVVAETKKENAVKAQMKKLQGGWQVTSMNDGMAVPAEEIKEFTFEFKGGQLYAQKTKRFPAKPIGKFKLDVSKKPKWIDIADDDSGKVIKGIYKVDGKELTLCVIGGSRSDQAPERPTEFKANEKKFHTLFVMKKIKK